jgi:hypothetical protein
LRRRPDPRRHRARLDGRGGNAASQPARVRRGPDHPAAEPVRHPRHRDDRAHAAGDHQAGGGRLVIPSRVTRARHPRPSDKPAPPKHGAALAVGRFRFSFGASRAAPGVVRPLPQDRRSWLAVIHFGARPTVAQRLRHRGAMVARARRCVGRHGGGCCAPDRRRASLGARVGGCGRARSGGRHPWRLCVRAGHLRRTRPVDGPGQSAAATRRRGNAGVGRGPVVSRCGARGRARLLLGAERVGAGRADTGPDAVVSGSAVLHVLRHPLWRDRRGVPAGIWRAAHATPGRAVARLRHYRRLRCRGRGRDRGHRRQLHVPAPKAGGRLPAGLHGPMAGLHRCRRRGCAGDVRRAGGAGALVGRAGAPGDDPTRGHTPKPTLGVRSSTCSGRRTVASRRSSRRAQG